MNLARTHFQSDTDLAEFMALPLAAREDVAAWMGELALLTRPIQAGLRSIAHRLGVSQQTARRKYDAWRAKGDWRSLVNHTKIPKDRRLAPEFIAFWRGLCVQNSRKCAPAYREFVRRFRAGAEIPGLPPGTDRLRIPRGYSYDNLMRFAPTEFELKAVRIGRGAADDCRPKIFTSRRNLEVGQYFVFDDMWHDFMVMMIGQRSPARLLQLHAHDLFSGCQFARGLKARIEDATGKRLNLTESEMLFLVSHVLEEYGFHPDGCTLMVEHGTATVDDVIIKALYDLSGGKIRVDFSGIESAGMFAGQYAGASKGNFRFKAALESLGNLIHNETADVLMFPGQTGSNSRINAPEELVGRTRHASHLATALLALPEKSRELLRMPFLEVNQAKWLVGEIMERINTRTEHDLEGWLERGLTAIDYFVPGIGLIPQARFLELPADKRAVIEAAAQPQARKLSPREVFDDGRRNLLKFRPEQTAMLLATREGKEVSVGNDHLIVFEDQTISPAPIRYLAHHWQPGTKFRAVVNPMSPLSPLHLFDAAGRWIGIVKPWQTIDRENTPALERAMGASAKALNELLAPVRKMGAAITRQRMADTKHNIDVVTEATGPTPEQKQFAAEDADLVKRYGDESVESILQPSEPAQPAANDDADDFLNTISNKDT